MPLGAVGKYRRPYDDEVVRAMDKFQASMQAAHRARMITTLLADPHDLPAALMAADAYGAIGLAPAADILSFTYQDPRGVGQPPLEFDLSVRYPKNASSYSIMRYSDGRSEETRHCYGTTIIEPTLWPTAEEAALAKSLIEMPPEQDTGFYILDGLRAEVATSFWGFLEVEYDPPGQLGGTKPTTRYVRGVHPLDVDYWVAYLISRFEDTLESFRIFAPGSAAQRKGYVPLPETKTPGDPGRLFISDNFLRF